MSRKKIKSTQVEAELPPGQSRALLQELHLLTRAGDLNADARRKLKQINHYCTMLRPDLEALFERHDAPVLVDAGAGNAYLGFVLYEFFLSALGRGELYCVDVRNDVVQRGQSRATKLGYERLRFLRSSIEALIGQESGDHPQQEEGPRALGAVGPVHAVISLHACDTATDEAILLGLKAEAELISLVPCCQTEVHGLLQGTAARSRLGPLWRHAWHRREFGAHLTNVIRALVLEAHGYKVRVTELVGWEHSAKNELIVAVKHQRGNALARRQLDALLAELPPLDMKLLRAVGPAPAD